jgi:ATP-dependent Clp protease ATP-binding subunit ClpA
MNIAISHARRLGHNFVSSELLLLGLLQERVGIAANALITAGVKPRTLREAIEQRLGHGSGVVAWEIPLTPRCKSVLEASWRIAREYQDNYLETEHILLALLEDKDSLAFQILNELDIDTIGVERDVRQRIARRHEVARQNNPVKFADQAEKEAYLKKCRDQMTTWFNRAIMAKHQSREELVKQALERKWQYEQELARVMGIDPPDEPEDPDDLIDSGGPDDLPPNAPAGVPRRPKPASGDTDNALRLPQSDGDEQ